MSSGNEVRIKLPPELHQKWQQAANVRGLTLKGFISATISAELIRTGELLLATETPLPVATPAPKPLTPEQKADIESVWGTDDDD